MAANEGALGALHEQLTKVMSEALKGTEVAGYIDPDTGVEHPGTVVPPSAAIMAVAAKFLKDNNITCAPAKDNALGELEQRMREAQEKRRAKRTDLSLAKEDASFMTGLH